MKVGCIGLGRMGAGLCESLLRAGHQLTVYDVCLAAKERFAGRAALAQSARAASLASEAVVLSLPDAPAVEQVVGELMEGCVAGRLVIDTSTSLPETTVSLHKKLAEAGARFLDAPLAGTPEAARQGTLMVYVGGAPEALEAARPVLGSFAAQVRYMGGPGSGNVAKLVNNYLAIQYAVLYCEIFPLARAAGADVQALFGAIGQTGVACVPYRLYGEKIAAGEYPLSFSIDLAYKDLRYAAAMAPEAARALPLMQAGLARLAEARAEGMGGADLSQLACLAERQLGGKGDG
ncbi:NAD(P)-dependent oxidoreductase [Allofournierella sp.]|uniref:NAD(P)-dependent oxidoreductase n=1 Tax=Allofournierella sp. TaxID=1940256 RepID=UPI003AB5510D